MSRDAIATAWAEHVGRSWPQFASPYQGQLMTLDTVISGCVVYYLDSPEGLDEQRLTILHDCLTDIRELIDNLDMESQAYFERLQQLGQLLLETASRE